MKKIVLGVLMLSAAAAYAGGYTGKSNITWIGTIRNNQFSISGDWGNPMGCPEMGGKIWRIRSDSNSMEELQAMYSAVLAAYMGGKTIELYSHECGDDGRPHARGVFIPSRHG